MVVFAVAVSHPWGWGDLLGLMTGDDTAQSPRAAVGVHYRGELTSEECGRA